ncbi:PhzF family phenazine biosynthesis protein [uncultured Amnibacterium sp.]|uniref:PhzF family phenazine biosynthesis protein n=1 Tax=uncultured Amnibacterium sp. TaxID=1631851 RepID=UPI0035CBAEC1
MDVPFFWIDVFADRPLTGNPLALVPDADALDARTMQAIAREFNQSETTFIVAPDLPKADHRLRSFTPAGVEVLGAGHNAMGAWIWLAQAGRLDPSRTAFMQQIGDELLEVELTRTDGGPAVSMTQSPPTFVRHVPPDASVAAALGLTADDLDHVQGAEVVSTGVPHLLVAALSRAAVDRAVPDARALLDELAATGAEGCFLYTVEGDEDAYARFFNPTVGIAEDPATGTAAGPLAALLLRASAARSGTVVIEQGTALGRPSRLEVAVDGDLVQLRGSGVLAAQGILRL